MTYACPEYPITAIFFLNIVQLNIS
jgi:hypothetical protein